MKDYRIVAEERVFKTPRMEAKKRVLKSDDGDCFTHTIIHSEPSVATIIRFHGRIALIRQLRSTTNQYYWEIPAGLKNEDEECMCDAAAREVREETGIIVKDLKMLVNGPSLLDPSKSDEDFGVAIGTFGGRTETNLDENEKIEKGVTWMSEKEVFERLKNQMQTGEPFYQGLHMSGHSMYALLAYRFLREK